MADGVEVRLMSVDDLSGVREIDRTESLSAKHEVVRSCDGLALSLGERPCDPPEELPNWDEEGQARRVRWWQHELAAGGAVFGAFREERLVGLAIVAARRNGAEVPGMLVDAGSRRRGIGTRPLAAVEVYASGTSAGAVYLHPNPSPFGVGFYRKHGYRLTCLVDEATLSYPEMETCIVPTKPLPGPCGGGRIG